jgi:hypothetical protein
MIFSELPLIIYATCQSVAGAVVGCFAVAAKAASCVASPASGFRDMVDPQPISVAAASVKSVSRSMVFSLEQN